VNDQGGHGKPLYEEGVLREQWVINPRTTLQAGQEAEQKTKSRSRAINLNHRQTTLHKGKFGWKLRKTDRTKVSVRKREEGGGAVGRN